ncbi:uncharacterized protein MKK02DRAFT_29516 [Dioszegia hungarica]|uniref:RRM domain-containing protein n=1 Tax=Dioszegia hungarica TaxID=4972 RepID=A0AA38HDA9_9TREE|nr:uncharacterized protein MKK02DRAFT_29516 [Dioszegia hungarica]KAI9639458.1 hypothetical protein MKK02DRAFT_29516 [Dioszegia hungarica]
MSYNDLDYPRSPRDTRDDPALMEYDEQPARAITTPSPPSDHQSHQTQPEQNQHHQRTDSRSNNHNNGNHQRARSDRYDDRYLPRRAPAPIAEPMHAARFDNNRRAPPQPRGDRDWHSAPSRDGEGSSGARKQGGPLKAGANPVLGVFGLSIRTKEADLEHEFARHGEVEKVVIVYDQRASPSPAKRNFSSKTDRSRGFGFITMRTTEDAQECVDKLNGQMLHGREMRVDFSATQKPHNPTPGEYMGAKRPLRQFLVTNSVQLKNGWNLLGATFGMMTGRTIDTMTGTMIAAPVIGVVGAGKMGGTSGTGGAGTTTTRTAAEVGETTMSVTDADRQADAPQPQKTPLNLAVPLAPLPPVSRGASVLEETKQGRQPVNI